MGLSDYRFIFKAAFVLFVMIICIKKANWTNPLLSVRQVF